MLTEEISAQLLTCGAARTAAELRRRVESLAPSGHSGECEVPVKVAVRSGRRRAPAEGVVNVLTEGFSRYGRSAQPLLERDAEVAELEAALGDACQGRGRLLLVEGPAGIGKTRLIGEVRRRAGPLGMTVLTARGGELERDFGFGIVRQLLEPPLASAGTPERAQLLSGAARSAEPVFGVAGGQDQAARTTHALLHGLYWVTVNLAERSPLLLAIDDVQWADEPSLRFLLHLARRLDGVRAGIVIASRTGEPGHSGLLSSLVLEARPPVLRPGPLSEAAVGGMVRAALGDDAGLELCAACRQATGGNPFLLTELTEELRRAGGAVADISPAAVARLGPERIARALLLRAGSVSPCAPALVRAVAVLGTRAELDQAAGLAGIGPAQARATARALAAAAVMEPGEPLCFTHPVVRTAIYDDIPAGERSALHDRAASLLADWGAAPEVIAVHLLACDPAGDPARAATLRKAAHAALSRGVPETAARYLRRALAERTPQDMRPDLLFELGWAAARAGDPEGLDLMRDGFELTSEPARRAAAGLELGAALAWHGRVAESMLVYDVALAGARETHLATRIEAMLLLAADTAPGGRPRVAGRLPEARLRAARLPAEVAPILLVPLTYDAVLTGSPAAEATELATRALAGGFLLQEQVEKDLPLLYPLLWALIHVGQLDMVEAALRQAITRTRTRGSPLGLNLGSAFTAFARHRAGELGAAEAEARTALELAVVADWGIPVQIAAATLVSVLVERGDLMSARALLERLKGTYDPELTTSQPLRESHAKLLMAEGDPRKALEELLAVARWERAMQIPGTVVPVPWRSAAALAQAALGERDAARALAEEEIGVARRIGDPRAIGIALHARGQIEPGKRGIEHLQAAARALERSADRLEYARALVDLGSALRRAGRTREARSNLAEGLDLAHQCGAGLLLNAARQQLTMAGARPRRMALSGPDALTPSERRVTQMAAEGMSNKEIAQSLFVTLRTVEMHLSSAYGKLKIESRHGLPRALHVAGNPKADWSG